MCVRACVRTCACVRARAPAYTKEEESELPSRTAILNHSQESMDRTNPGAAECVSNLVRVC